MKKWRQIRMADVVQKLDYGISASSNPRKEGARFLRITDIRNGRVDWEDVPGLAESVAITENQKLRDGDILFARTGGTVGKSFLVSDPPDACFASYLIRLRCKPEVTPHFLSLFLQSDDYWDQIRAAARGGAQPNINTKSLADLKLSIPPIETQHRIAAELDEQLGAIDEARAAAERRVAAAEALEAALLREHFHGLTPVLIGLPKEAAPAGWKWTRLVELADLESGHTPSRKHPEWWGGDIPWIALPDIRALDGKVAMETKENTNPLGIANSSARILPKDTVALSRTASVGFVTLFGRPMATSQDFVNWVCGKDLSPAFLLHALRASREHFLANASGAIHKTIYMPAVKDFHLCHPARKTQETLAAALTTRLADAATLLSAARAELAAIQALPAAALRRVFS